MMNRIKHAIQKWLGITAQTLLIKGLQTEQEEIEQRVSNLESAVGDPLDEHQNIRESIADIKERIRDLTEYTGHNQNNETNSTHLKARISRLESDLHQHQTDPIHTHTPTEEKGEVEGEGDTSGDAKSDQKHRDELATLQAKYTTLLLEKTTAQNLADGYRTSLQEQAANENIRRRNIVEYKERLNAILTHEYEVSRNLRKRRSALLDALRDVVNDASERESQEAKGRFDTIIQRCTRAIKGR